MWKEITQKEKYLKPDKINTLKKLKLKIWLTKRLFTVEWGRKNSNPNNESPPKILPIKREEKLSHDQLLEDNRIEQYMIEDEIL